jgi:c-di-GMP-binding flagellar brake protein YcgR
MVDISRGGMRAVSSRSYYPGQRIVLCLPVSQASGRRSIYATVVRCRQEEEGYCVGLRFDTASVGAWYGAEMAAA